MEKSNKNMPLEHKDSVVQRHVYTVVYPGILFGGGGSTNSVEDRGQR